MTTVGSVAALITLALVVGRIGRRALLHYRAHRHVTELVDHQQSARGHRVR
jgi:hypothetical protein